MSLPSYESHPQWKEFFRGPEISFVEEIVEEKWISSTKTKIHLDIYPQSKGAPTIVFCHGLASCGRIMAHLSRPLYKKGFNIICPDLVGFGLTLQKPGTGNIPTYIENLKDTIRYARRRFGDNIYLAGMSLGGALSYYTAAAGANVNAISCYCLLDLSAKETHDIGSLPKPLIQPSVLALGLAKRIIPNVRIPLKHMISLDTLSDYPEFNEVFQKNPLAVKTYTFQGAHSLLTAVPPVPFEEYNGPPVLVLHGSKDRMIPERLSRINYEKIAGTKKYVSVKGCEHVPTSDEHLDIVINETVKWFRKY